MKNKEMIEEKDKLYILNTILQEVKPLKLREKIYWRIVEFINRKLPKDSVVLSREEYDELINLQRTHAEDLTNAIQSYEESKAELKIEYSNHIKNLEKTIDRQSKDLNSQADRLIDLKAELENKGKETVEKFAKLIEFHSISKRDESGYETFTISNLCMREILREEFGFTNEELETMWEIKE